MYCLGKASGWFFRHEMSDLFQSVFHHSASLCYSFCGYNMMFGARHLKQYDPQCRLCAMVIRALRMCPQLDPDQETIIESISCVWSFILCTTGVTLIYCFLYYTYVLVCATYHNNNNNTYTTVTPYTTI